MDLEAYIGTFVQLSLQSGMSLKGTIAAMDHHLSDLSLSSMSLIDVTGFFHGNKIMVSNVEVPTNKITDLRVLDPTSYPSSPTSSSSEQGDHHDLVLADPAIVSLEKPIPHKHSSAPYRSTSSSAHTKPAKSQQHSIKSSSSSTFNNLGDLSTYHETEFDFQAALLQFDKKHEFDLIRRDDDQYTPPTPNPANGHAKAPLPPLSSFLLRHNPSSVHRPVAKLRRKPQPNRANDIPIMKPRKIQTCTKINIPLISPLLMVEAERIAHADAGIPLDIIIENAGRSLAELILQILGNHRFTPLHYTVPPHLILMCGDNQTGAITLVAGRHLANRGARVSVLLSYNQQLATDVTAKYFRSLCTFQLVTVCTEISDLPNVSVDTIVDGLLGIYSIRDIPQENDREFVCDLMAWANRNNAPVLSVDVPSGLDALLGTIPFPPHRIMPDYTLCIGLPKLGISDPPLTGQIYLADCGIPWFVWTRLGVHGLQGPLSGGDLIGSVFEDRFLVPLEYVD